jgi:hypothetical protein
MKPLLLSLSDMETSKTVMVAPALGHFKSDGLTPGAAKFAYKAVSQRQRGTPAASSIMRVHVPDQKCRFNYYKYSTMHWTPVSRP